MPVAINAVVETPIASAWTIIFDFENLQRWHPLVKIASLKAREDAVRMIHFVDSWAIERLDRLDPQGARSRICNH